MKKENGDSVCGKGLPPSSTQAAGWVSMVRGRCVELSPTDGFACCAETSRKQTWLPTRLTFSRQPSGLSIRNRVKSHWRFIWLPFTTNAVTYASESWSITLPYSSPEKGHSP